MVRKKLKANRGSSKTMTAREEALAEIHSFIESPQVKEAVGRVAMGKEQFISAARQWVLVCGEVEQLYTAAERLEQKIAKESKDKKFRLKKEQLPVQQLLSELNLANDKASVSKMRTIGRALFLRKAEYERSLPAAKETLYITAQALGAGDKSTFNAASAEQNFKKIIDAEDYSADAPRATVMAIANQVLGIKKKTKKRSKPQTRHSEVRILRAVIALVSASPDISLTMPPSLKTQLHSLALKLLESKQLSEQDWNVWSSVAA